MIRRLNSCVLGAFLGLALLLAQLGGVRHELSHWQSHVPTSPSQGAVQTTAHSVGSLPSHDSGDSANSAELACHLCALYAQLTHALNNTPLTALGVTLFPSSPTRLSTAFQPPAPSRIKIRGPPSLS
jgi:hypothetical protein